MAYLAPTKGCLRHRGWSLGGPIILLWTVWGTAFGGTTYSMTGQAQTQPCCLHPPGAKPT